MMVHFKQIVTFLLFQVNLPNKTITIPSGQFCLIFEVSITEESDKNGSIKTYPFFCEEEFVEIGAEITQNTYPVLIFISCCFIFVTLIVNIILKENRTKLFGKLTIGFLANVFLAFLFTGVHYSLNVPEHKSYLDTPFCKFLGYIVQHTWIAFFFWMSAMSINITQTFTQNFRNTRNESRSTTRIILYTLYAQGIPLLITMVTLIMDYSGTKDQIVPNMAVFSCFLGQEYSSNPDPFYMTSVFLYFYLAITIVIVMNFICFIITGFSLMKHWVQMKSMEQSSNNGPLTQARILLNLFIIMGVPWIFEIISAYVDHTFPDSESKFESRLALDIISMLQGIFIFLALVCKPQVMKSVRTTITSTFSSTASTSSTSSQASRTSTVSMESRGSPVIRVPRS